jgi:recombination protein RecR
MYIDKYPSKLLENAVQEFSKLPGIGERTALRLVLWLLNQDKQEAVGFGNSIIELKEQVKFCKTCFNISDSEQCEICASPRRDKGLICVVETLRDVLSIENTQQYQGVYHVLGGKISPLDGIGPRDLHIEQLIKRVSENNDIYEVIFALSTTMEGDTTNFYLYKKLQPYHVRLSTLARGLAVGDELEYADEITLGRSISNRIPFTPSS